MISYLKIIRPINCLFVGLTTLIGFYYMQSFGGIELVTTRVTSAEPYSFPMALIICLSAFFIAAGGYTINDFYDYEIDKINRPERVLPRGSISLNSAKNYAFLLFIAGVIISFFTKNYFCISIAVINACLLFWYAHSLKKSFLIGNIIVAWNACSTFIYGAIMSQNMRNILPLVCFSFLYTLIREWVKIIEDVEGDREGKVRSIAVVMGENFTLTMIVIVIGLIVISNCLFSFWGFMSRELFAILSFVINIPLFSFYHILNKNHTPKIVSKVQKYMKLNMLSIVMVFIIYDIIKIRV